MTIRTGILGFLVCLQVLVILNNHNYPWTQYLWFCDFAPTLLAAALLLRNDQALKGILNVILGGQVGYLILFAWKYFFDESVMHFVFTRELTLEAVVSTGLIHLSALIVYLYTTDIVPTYRALVYALGLLVITYALVRLTVIPTGDDLTNYNLIYHSHLFAGYDRYTMLWVPLAFIFVVVPTHLFQLIVSLWYTRTNRNPA